MTKNAKLTAWVNEVAAMCQPDRVVWCDGSSREYQGVLDLMVHFHDLPLYPGSATYVGFGLWANLPVTAIIETALFVTGIVLYFTSTTAKNRKGKWNIWLLIILLVATHVYSFWAPPPASIKELAWSAQVQWVFVLLAYWGDRNRKPTHLSMS